MNSLQFFLLFSVGLFASTVVARPGQFGGAQFGGGQFGGCGGPLAAVRANLTAEQRDQLAAIFREARNETKAALKQRIDGFVSGLSAEQQAAVREAEQRIDEFKTNLTARVQQLSQPAQDLFANVTAVLNDDSLTFEQQSERLHALVQAADPSVLQEFRQQNVPVLGLLGGGHQRGGGWNGNNQGGQQFGGSWGGRQSRGTPDGQFGGSGGFGQQTGGQWGGRPFGGSQFGGSQFGGFGGRGGRSGENDGNNRGGFGGFGNSQPFGSGGRFGGQQGGPFGGQFGQQNGDQQGQKGW
ncbi:hypothetical protein M3Y99_00246200 [Aphelenchoides fujianensis]|nr:hypothetical protein M3Y99_00246200 [Aphelenchoides fujianensis]